MSFLREQTAVTTELITAFNISLMPNSVKMF